MDGPIFDKRGIQVATRVGMVATSLDGTKSYDIDLSGNLLEQKTGKVKGSLVPGGAFLPGGEPSPGQDLF